ncbi:MAG: energy-coupling factor ABC transporter permease [Candidatus Kerfeldbacteria bacterium]|nr:energy-coupling factor ABC transporter permease [Candidatus Kerfeldbacteria bacterium]
MHLPDGSLPHNLANGLAAGAAGVFAVATRASLGALVRRVRVARMQLATQPFGNAAATVTTSFRLTGRGRTVLTRALVVAPVLFLAQSVNVALGGPVDGHPIGAAFVAIALGPTIGFVVMSLVLALETAVFSADTMGVLGGNIVNFGVVGVLGSAYAYRFLRRPLGGNGAAALIAWGSVVIIAIVTALELSVRGEAAGALTTIILPHMLIALVEAVLTVLALRLLRRVRTDTHP